MPISVTGINPAGMLPVSIPASQMANVRNQQLNTQLVTNATRKGSAIGGYKYNPGYQQTRYMPTWINEQAVAAGASVTFNWGTVHDIVDINQVALAAGNWTVATPDGDLIDAFMLTRLKNDPLQHYELPPGRYTWTNITAGALNLELGVHQVNTDD